MFLNNRSKKEVQKWFPLYVFTSGKNNFPSILIVGQKLFSNLKAGCQTEFLECSWTLVQSVI